MQVKSSQLSQRRGLLKPHSGCASISIHAARWAKDLILAVLLFLLPLGAVLMAPAAQAQSISFAGSQTAVAASGLSQPTGVAVDGAGNVFIADYGNSRVVKVPAGGGAQITVGSGLSLPAGVAVDAAENVFIADFNHNRVVKVPAGCTSADCQITVVSGLSLPAGVAVDAAGDVFIADTSNSRVLKLSPDSAQSTVGSGLRLPEGLAVDGAGNVFIADYGNNRVVKVPPGCTSADCQSTVGSGLSLPNGVAVDVAGNVFIADGENSRVLKVSPDGAQITVGSGLSLPNGVAVDSAGNVFIADAIKNRVVKVSLTGNFGTVNVCPSGQASPAPCSETLTLNYNVTGDGTLGNAPTVVTQGAPNLDFTLAGGSTCTGDVAAGSSCTVNLTFAPRAPGLRMGVVQLADASANLLGTTSVYGEGKGPAVAFDPGVQKTVGSGLLKPGGVAVDAAGNVFIADTFNNRVVKVPADGGAQITVGSRLNEPIDVAVDGAGNVFIADTYNNRVVKVPPRCTSADCQTTVGSELNQPYGVAVDGAGNVFIADYNNNRVVKVSPDGAQTTVLGSGLNLPADVAVDGAGNVFIADSQNTRVLKVSPDGTQIPVVSGLYLPISLAVDAAGNLFIADQGANGVLKVSPDRAQTTLGSGLGTPSGVAVDGAGNVFIGDFYNDRVVEVQRSQPPALSFAATPVGNTSSDSPQSVTVENAGNGTLSLSGLTVGSNFAQIAGSGTPADCTSSSSLTPGESCNLSLSFTPSSAGPITGSATLTDNSLNGNPATQTISLSGTGNQQQTQTITFNPIAGQVLGTPLTLSASASSNLTVSFASQTPAVCTVSGTTATLVKAGTCTIQASQSGNTAYVAATPVPRSFLVTDFSLTVTPASQTITPGKTAVYSAALRALNGFSGTVTLGCTGLPAKSTCSLSPASVALSGTRSSSISVATKTKGTSRLTITARSGADVHTATASITVK
ncbi:MAG: choice-of-anchor D domain-containing protein [Bryobacteraceae bacterium]